MPKLRRISGEDILSALTKEGFAVIRQKGSHVRLVNNNSGLNAYITIPLHKEIDRGTLKSIIRSLERTFSKEKILEIFYK
jgi:predicted RNA binding protein YcfA (HicA-like mRNA interferase family)